MVVHSGGRTYAWERDCRIAVYGERRHLELCAITHGAIGFGAPAATGYSTLMPYIGRSRGGFSTKVHLRAEGGGQLMTVILTPGHRHEAMVFEQLPETGAVKRRGPGRPKRRPHRIVGDKGYSSGRSRRYARQPGIRITIPRKQDECDKGPFNRAFYRLRHRIEWLVKTCCERNWKRWTRSLRCNRRKIPSSAKCSTPSVSLHSKLSPREQDSCPTGGGRRALLAEVT
jgi:hypothetical protein